MPAVSLIDRIEGDLTAAMKERDSERRDTLRLILSSLRSAEKELQRTLHEDEELQVLQRERKRRVEAIEAFRGGDREEQAQAEERELEILEEFMPEPLAEEELERIVDDAIAEVGATSIRDLGRVMADVMPQIAGRADGAAVSQIVREKLGLTRPGCALGGPTYTGLMQEVLDVSNDVAAELASVGDGVLGALRDRLACTIRLRGNRLVLEGDEQHVAEARSVIDEIVELVEGGHEIGPGTVDAVIGAIDEAHDVREIFDDVVWRHRGKKIAPKTVIRSTTSTRCAGEHDHVRHRPRRHRQDLPRDGARRRRAVRAAGRAHHPHAPGGRGGRAARLPAGRPAREGRPVPAPAVRRAVRHARPRPPRRATWSTA